MTSLSGCSIRATRWGKVTVMGANAQTTVQKFLSGAVLTAEQQNFSAATGVPVFATTVTRDAAFGGANKVLAEGQTCYLESTNVVQYYDGAAWATVGPTAAPTSGLVVVKAETAFTTDTSITADNVFTSAYTNYRVLVRYTSTSNELTFQLRVGAVDAATNYNTQRLRIDNSTIEGVRNTGATSALFAHTGNGSFFCYAAMEISGPQLAAPTVYQSLCTRNSAAYTSPIINQYFGNHSTAAAYDGLKILTAAGTMTGVYSIYGYGKTL